MLDTDIWGADDVNTFDSFCSLIWYSSIKKRKDRKTNNQTNEKTENKKDEILFLDDSILAINCSYQH